MTQEYCSELVAETMQAEHDADCFNAPKLEAIGDE